MSEDPPKHPIFFVGRCDVVVVVVVDPYDGPGVRDRVIVGLSSLPYCCCEVNEECTDFDPEGPGVRDRVGLPPEGPGVRDREGPGVRDRVGLLPEGPGVLDRIVCRPPEGPGVCDRGLLKTDDGPCD